MADQFLVQEVCITFVTTFFSSVGAIIFARWYIDRILSAEKAELPSRESVMASLQG